MSGWILLAELLIIIGGILWAFWELSGWLANKYVYPYMARKLGKRWGKDPKIVEQWLKDPDKARDELIKNRAE
jgi:hypothetical protein